jgi:hypothetical protein
MGMDPKELPFAETILLQHTQDNRIEWELQEDYLYTLGTMAPASKMLMSAQTLWGEYRLKYDGATYLYFNYNSMELGYIQISPEFQQAIRDNGERLINRLNDDLTLVLGNR